MINISHFSELSLEKVLENQVFDLLIGFLCYESRSSYVLKKAYEKCSKELYFFDSQKDNFHQTVYNKSWMKKVDHFDIAAVDLDISADLETKIIRTLLSFPNQSETIKVLLDISSMPRKIMASVMSAIEEVANIRKINMVVAYCLAKYSPPPDSQSPPNKTVRPAHPSFAGWAIDPGLPVAAIVGLGYEEGKALGAVEYIQSKDWWVFVPNSEERKYLKKVLLHNKGILNAIGDERKFEYSVHSPLSIISKLESLAAALQSTYKPVFLPFGPKIFFFCALLVSLVHKHCAVWYVSGENEIIQRDRIPSSYVLCFSFQIG